MKKKTTKIMVFIVVGLLIITTIAPMIMAIVNN